MDSCQPGQSIESDTICRSSSTFSISMEGSSSKNKREQLFVPIHDSKKNKKKRTEMLLADIETSVTEMKEILKNDPSRELLDFLKSESEQQKRRDELFLQILQAMTTPTEQPHYAFYSQQQMAS